MTYSDSSSTPPAAAASKTSDEPLRVCLLVEPSPFSYVCGYTNRFQALLSYLHEQKDYAEIVTTEVVALERPQSWLGAFPVHYTRGFRLPHYPLMSVSLDWTFCVARVLRAMRPDLMHVSSPGLLVLGAVGWSRIFGIPLVLSYHTHLPAYVHTYVRPPWLRRVAAWFVWRLIRFFHSWADLTVVTSPQVQQEFLRHKVPRCQIWQKGIDTERFHPRQRSERMRERMTHGHPGDFLVVYIGRLGSEKRVKDLRDIIRRMHGDDKTTTTKTRLCIVGTGPQEEELHSHFGDDEHCVFTGQLLGEELRQAFASADAFCMPSDSETLGFVVLESMASGVPVIGARAGGLQDLIEDGVTGFLVEPGDTQAFADRLLRLQNDKQLQRMLSENARRETEKWSWHASMAKLRNEQYTTALANFQNRLGQRLWRLITFRWKTSQASVCEKA